MELDKLNRNYKFDRVKINDGKNDYKIKMKNTEL